MKEVMYILMRDMQHNSRSLYSAKSRNNHLKRDLRKTLQNCKEIKKTATEIMRGGCGKITVVQLVLTIPNPIDFIKNYDKIGI